MDVKELFSGIGVIIDDQIFNKESHDKIKSIAKSLEEAHVPLLKYSDIPEDEIIKNLKDIGFIILDWDLHEGVQVGEEYENDLVDFIKNIFDTTASPIFIFSNKDVDKLTEKLTEHKLLRGTQQKPIFIRNKADLNGDANTIFTAIDAWLKKTPSVYLLKHWSKSFNDARVLLFKEFYKVCHNWPKVLWETEIYDIYGEGFEGDVTEDDEWETSSELSSLISKNIEAQMLPLKFDKEYILGDESEPTSDEITKVLSAQRFVKVKETSSSITGDLYKIDGEYYINIRPGCDCVSRGSNDGLLYLLKGERIKSKKLFDARYGKFIEQENYAIVGPIYKGWFFKFNFKHLRLLRYEDVKDDKLGRILPPYITHITEKYGLYLQRQALPRIPSKIVENFKDEVKAIDEGEKYKTEIARLKGRINELEKKEVKEITCKFKGHIRTKGRR